MKHSSQYSTDNWVDNDEPVFDFSQELTEAGRFKHNQQLQQHQNGCATQRGPFVSLLLVMCSVLDVLLVLGLAVLEYIFRWTNLVPIRSQILKCSENVSSSFAQSPEPLLNITDSTSRNDFYDQGQIPEIIVYVYSFSFPILVIVIGELLLFCLANQNFKPLPQGTCSPSHIPHTIRRLYRFSLTFLFGILIVMLMVEGLKVCLGVLAPQFWSICQAQMKCPSSLNNLELQNESLSAPNIIIIDEIQLNFLCAQKNQLLLRKARTSFPSMRAALSMYSAIFASIYMHGIAQVHHFKYLWLPLISVTTVVVSMLCGLRLVGSKEAWISDVIVGHVIGAVIALYLGLIYMRGFLYQESVSNRRLLRQIASLSSVDNMHRKKRLTREFSDSPIHDDSNASHAIVRLRRHYPHSHPNPYSPATIATPIYHHPGISPCTTTTRPNTTNTTTTTTSTFLPSQQPHSKPNPLCLLKQQRKSVTLPISSPHVPPNTKNKPSLATASTLTSNTVTPSYTDSNSYLPNRYSMVPLPSSRRHLLLNRNLPTISQELIDLLNDKQIQKNNALNQVDLVKENNCTQEIQETFIS